MYINDDKQIIVRISEVFDKNVIVEVDGKVKIVDETTIRGLLDFIYNSTPFVILDEDQLVVSDINQRNVLYRRLNWLFSKLLLITIHDESAR